MQNAPPGWRLHGELPCVRALGLCRSCLRSGSPGNNSIAPRDAKHVLLLSSGRFADRTHRKNRDICATRGFWSAIARVVAKIRRTGTTRHLPTILLDSIVG